MLQGQQFSSATQKELEREMNLRDNTQRMISQYERNSFGFKKALEAYGESEGKIQNLQTQNAIEFDENFMCEEKVPKQSVHILKTTPLSERKNNSRKNSPHSISKSKQSPDMRPKKGHLSRIVPVSVNKERVISPLSLGKKANLPNSKKEHRSLSGAFRFLDKIDAEKLSQGDASQYDSLEMLALDTFEKEIEPLYEEFEFDGFLPYESLKKVDLKEMLPVRKLGSRPQPKSPDELDLLDQKFNFDKKEKDSKEQEGGETEENGLDNKRDVDFDDDQYDTAAEMTSASMDDFGGEVSMATTEASSCVAVFDLKSLDISPLVSPIKATPKRKRKKGNRGNQILQVRCFHEGVQCLSERIEMKPDQNVYNFDEPLKIQVKENFNLSVQAITTWESELKSKDHVTRPLKTKSKDEVSRTDSNKSTSSKMSVLGWRRKKNIPTPEDLNGSVIFNLNDLSKVGNTDYMKASTSIDNLNVQLTCQLHPLRPEVYIEDYINLKKEFCAWTMLYTRLSEKSLKCWTDESTVMDREPLFVIDLLTINTKRVDQSTSCQRLHAFEIPTVEGNFYIATESEFSCDLWISAINQALSDIQTWKDF